MIASAMMEQLQEKSRSAIVIGAGVIGVATAYALKRKGLNVTLVDAAKSPGAGTSYANGAQLSYNYTDALASPFILSSLPKLAFGMDEAFRMRIKPELRYAYWTAAFIRNCTRRRFLENTIAGLQLARLSGSAMAALQDRHNIDFGHTISGKMHLHYSSSGFETAKSLISMKERYGSAQKALSPADAIDLEPGLDSVSKELVGVIHSPGDAVGDAHKFCKEMVKLLAEEYDVVCRFNAKVRSLRLDQSRAIVVLDGDDQLEADVAVVCTGGPAAEILKPHDINLPVQPMKGYSFEIPVGNMSPKISITDAKRRIVFTNLGDKIRIAGLADLGDDSREVDEKRLHSLIGAAKASLPNAGLYDQAHNFWAGRRPMTPNSLPIISRPCRNLAINTGHGMLGWTMAMGSGERLAELI